MWCVCNKKSGDEIKCFLMIFYHEEKGVFIYYAAKIFSLLSIISYYAAHPIRRVLYLYD